MKISKRVRSWTLAVAGIALALGLTACSGTDGGDNGDDGDNGGGSTQQLTLDFSNSPTPLPALGDSHQWEGWLVTDDGPETTGTFKKADLSDNQISFEVGSDLASSANQFVLSIEPMPDDDPAPSATKYLSGELSDSSAELDINGVIGDFSGTTGTFALKAPTSQNAPDDDNQGIWFINPDGSMPPAAGFSSLPALNEKGWNYEGWVVDTSGDSPMPYTTGKFADVADPATAADQDGAGEFAGSNSDMFPPRPGSDYVTAGDSNDGFDLKSGDWNVVLSVEPQPDNSDAPFALKPFTASIETDAETGTAIDLQYQDDSLPTGQVTID